MNGVQVRNLYVVKRLRTNSDVPELPGDLKVIEFGPSTKNALSGKKGIQLQYMNPDKQLITSDFIVKDQVISVDSITGQGTKLKEAVLKLENAPIAGEDYVVDIIVHNYQTISDNSQLTKFGAVHAKSNMTSHEFMFRLAKSFALNFRRDEHVNKFFEFYLAEVNSSAPGYASATKVDFNTATPVSWNSANTYCVVVREVEQPTWYRGTFPKQTVNFDLAPHTVYDDGDEVQPFVTEENGLVKKQDTTTVIPNGYAMADLEYLCHGEIGDQIREANYPRNIRTKYMIADTDVTKMFDTVEIVFYYVGRNTSPEKAEKQITLAVDHALASTVSTSSIIAELGVLGIQEQLDNHETRITTLEG